MRLTEDGAPLLEVDVNMTDEPTPICRNCHRAIWRHLYGESSIWRHFDGLMLCQPDEDAPDFDGVRAAQPA